MDSSLKFAMWKENEFSLPRARAAFIIFDVSKNSYPAILRVRGSSARLLGYNGD